VQETRVRLAHASPGRIRLKVDRIKSNPVKAAEIETKLRTVPGILSAHANPVTGSLLLTYDEPASASMEVPFAVAQVLGISLNDFNPDELRRLMSHEGNGANLFSSSLSQQLESSFSEISAAVRRMAGMSLGELLPFALAVLGVRSLLVSEKAVSPSWHEYFWFAFSSYFILNRTNSPH
jgi:hypothetical protein